MQNTRQGGKLAEGDLESCTCGQEEQRMCPYFIIREYFGSNDPKTCATSQDLGLGAHFSQYMLILIN